LSERKRIEQDKEHRFSSSTTYYSYSQKTSQIPFEKTKKIRGLKSPLKLYPPKKVHPYVCSKNQGKVKVKIIPFHPTATNLPLPYVTLLRLLPKFCTAQFDTFLSPPN